MIHRAASPGQSRAMSYLRGGGLKASRTQKRMAAPIYPACRELYHTLCMARKKNTTVMRDQVNILVQFRCPSSIL